MADGGSDLPCQPALGMVQMSALVPVGLGLSQLRVPLDVSSSHLPPSGQSDSLSFCLETPFLSLSYFLALALRFASPFLPSWYPFPLSPIPTIFLLISILYDQSDGSVGIATTLGSEGRVLLGGWMPRIGWDGTGLECTRHLRRLAGGCSSCRCTIFDYDGRGPAGRMTCGQYQQGCRSVCLGLCYR